MKSRLTRGAIWLASGRVLINLTTFASTLVLARLLSPGDFGLVALAMTVLSIVSSITDLSLTAALIQNENPDDTHYDTAWTLNLLRAVAIAVVISVIALPVAWFYADDRLIGLIVALGASVGFTGLVNPKIVTFSRNLVFWQEFLIGVSQKLASFVVSVGVAIIYRTYWALILGTIASQVVGVVVSYMVAPYRPRLSLQRARELWSFSVWLSLGQAVTTLNLRFDALFIGYFLGKPTLGLYSVGDNLALLPTRETTAPIVQTLFPGFSRLNDNPPRLKSAYQSAQALVSLVALPVGFGFAAVAHPFVLLFMGQKWLPAVLIIQVLSCAVSLQTISNALQPLAMAKGATKLLFQRELLSFAIRVPLVVGGLLLGGIVGVLCGRAIGSLLGTWINLLLVRKLIAISIRQQLSGSIRAITGAVVMLGAVLALQATIFADATTPAALGLQIGVSALFGAIVFVAVVGGMWLATGRPEGPERDIGGLFLRLGGQIKARYSESRA